MARVDAELPRLQFANHRLPPQQHKMRTTEPLFSAPVSTAAAEDTRESIVDTAQTALQTEQPAADLQPSLESPFPQETPESRPRTTQAKPSEIRPPKARKASTCRSDGAPADKAHVAPGHALRQSPH